MCKFCENYVTATKLDRARENNTPPEPGYYIGRSEITGRYDIAYYKDPSSRQVIVVCPINYCPFCGEELSEEQI